MVAGLIVVFYYVPEACSINHVVEVQMLLARGQAQGPALLFLSVANVFVQPLDL